MSIRVGMLTPSSNTCLEPVTYRLLAGTEEVTAHFSRLPVTRIGLDTEASAQFQHQPMLAAASLLADAKVDVLAWNGTAGSWLGPDRDRELAGVVAKATGIPTTTSTLALLAAFRAYGVTRLGLATPYVDEVGTRIAERYAAEGVQVVAQANLGITDNEAFARIPRDRIRDLVAAAGSADVHAVAVVCTNVPAAPLAAGLERDLGVPVLDSVAATLWKALDVAGAEVSLPGWGGLLHGGTLRARFQDICDELLDVTGCDRTTLRLDVPAHGLAVAVAAAEALRPGVRSIRRDASLDQRRLDTVVWLEDNRRNLVQPHVRGEPRAPQALIDVYGVKAQLLGPIERDGAMAGWLSAHSLAERPWTQADIAAMDAARARVTSLLKLAAGDCAARTSGPDTAGGSRFPAVSTAPSPANLGPGPRPRTPRGEDSR